MTEDTCAFRVTTMHNCAKTGRHLRKVFYWAKGTVHPHYLFPFPSFEVREKNAKAKRKRGKRVPFSCFSYKTLPQCLKIRITFAKQLFWFMVYLVLCFLVWLTRSIQCRRADTQAPAHIKRHVCRVQIFQNLCTQFYLTPCASLCVCFAWTCMYYCVASQPRLSVFFSLSPIKVYILFSVRNP